MKHLEHNRSRRFLSARLEKFENKDAVIITDDGQRLTWPIKDLPADCEVGSNVRITLSTAVTDQEEQTQIAKAILNEILKDGKTK
ncbi:MAG: hypothetical protein HUU49_04235 [Candidatus Buchananbacteria bacterium]|nr:hypothetical protein [Candidatus Buchananbacteria bacterium]